MNRLLLAALLFLAACTRKTEDTDMTVNNHSQTGEPEVCKFGITEFNLSKRPNIQDFEGHLRKPRNGNGNSNTSTSPSSQGVILLDFDGHVVTGTGWNYLPTINCTAANLSTEVIEEIINRVSNDYSPFNITVTTDEAVFTAAGSTKRTRIIVTETWEWYGQAGGVAFVGSFKDGSNNPAFVFSSLLGYSTKKIAEAVSHEAGHTIGLYHQTVYDANCILTSSYNAGIGDGETSWAPIMGVGYYRNLTLWHNGTNNYGCSSFQNDMSVIASVVGYRTDDHPNNFSGATNLSASASGIINTSNDVDMFSLSSSVSKTITLTPYNVGAGNSGANLDLSLKVYNSQGQLLHTADDPYSLNATITLPPGSYYIAAGTVANTNTSTYGMTGRYTITVN